MFEFSLVSYNIHGCIGTDGKYDPGRIANVLTELNPDIIGLQEVDSRRHPGTDADRQLRMLANATGLHPVAGPAQIFDAGHFGNALLTRFPVITIRHHDLSIPGLEPRGALDVDLSVNGAPLRIIVTHLGLKGSERRRQIKKLLESMQKPANELILMGDFNEWGSVRRGITRTINKLLGRTARIRTFPSRYPVFALDRIWVHPADLIWNVHSCNSALTRVASDHLPIKAILRAEIVDSKLKGIVPKLARRPAAIIS